jgi:hypothetical protein
VDDSGFSRTPDRLLKFYGTHVWLLEVFKTITSTCGPYYLGGSPQVVSTLMQWISYNITFENFKMILQDKSF